MASAAYVITTQTATPVFSVLAGTYTGPQIVTITDATPGATISYSTDGGTTMIQYTAPIVVSSTETLEAIATAPGFSSSAYSYRRLHDQQSSQSCAYDRRHLSGIYQRRWSGIHTDGHRIWIHDRLDGLLGCLRSHDKVWEHDPTHGASSSSQTLPLSEILSELQCKRHRQAVVLPMYFS